MVKEKVRKYNLQTVKSLARRLERSKKCTNCFGEKMGGTDELAYMVYMCLWRDRERQG